MIAGSDLAVGTTRARSPRTSTDDSDEDVHHSPKIVEFLYRFWTMTSNGYEEVQHLLSTRGPEDKYQGGFERENWERSRKTFTDLLDMVKARVGADILPDRAVLGCWCMVADYLWWDTSPLGVVVIHVEILVGK
ncbi:hypothetical protein TWF481_007698 [Arthrobotrys musiformis]|uniref:Uncharacterized protein n=1 Tax=Arthrobotrys musiformis TaxID=47236 RepID=A0AAV9WCD9_9PEZI